MLFRSVLLFCAFSSLVVLPFFFLVIVCNSALCPSVKGAWMISMLPCFCHAICACGIGQSLLLIPT